jgi:cell division transport system permease protein
MNGVPESIRPRLPGGFNIPPFGIHQYLALVIVAVALWALGAVWLGMQGAQQWVGSWQQTLAIHVYLPTEKRENLAALQQELASLKGVAEVSEVPESEKRQWLGQWLAQTGIESSEVLRRLPETLVVRINDTTRRFLAVDLRDTAKRHGGMVNEDELKLMRAQDVLDQLQSLAWFVTALLGLAMALIISNTLRMILLARQDEVHLMRLMGAQEWFVRMPFVLEGTLLGAGAGLLAWLLMWPLILATSEWLAAMSVELHAFVLLLPMLIGGAVIGALGAVIATARLVSPESVET